jgi:uncharacterized protein (DUF4415 family)
MKPNIISKIATIDQTDWKLIDAMSDADIDFSDNPAWTDTDFANAKPRSPYKTSNKLPIHILLPPDIATFFQAIGEGWQSKVEDILRAYIATHQS